MKWKLLKPILKQVLGTREGRKTLQGTIKEFLFQGSANVVNREKKMAKKKHAASWWTRLMGNKDEVKEALNNIELRLKRMFLFQLISTLIAVAALVIALLK